MLEKQIVIQAGPHDRENCPVWLLLDVPVGLVPVSLLDGDSPVSYQWEHAPGAEKASLAWILARLPRGGEKRYRLVLGEAASEKIGVGVGFTEPAQGQLDIAVAGQLFTTYHYGDVPRPYFHPVIGPWGLPVTRGYPMLEIPGETTDHVHHRSLWVAHGDVNGVDNWSEAEGYGRIAHRGFRRLAQGAVYGEFLEELDWLTAQGTPTVAEERRVVIYHVPPLARLMELEVTFKAAYGDVTFGDTKEGGIAALRVSSSMDGARGGKIENSYGGINEKETWGKRAHWCDYSGTVGSRQVGIAIFDHPKSFGHPTYWHVRNYGLMAANCFALSHYENDPAKNGSYTLRAGGQLRFLYRIYIHQGDAAVGKVSARYHDYANPPEAAVV